MVIAPRNVGEAVARPPNGFCVAVGAPMATVDPRSFVVAERTNGAHKCGAPTADAFADRRADVSIRKRLVEDILLVRDVGPATPGCLVDKLSPQIGASRGSGSAVC